MQHHSTPNVDPTDFWSHIVTTADGCWEWQAGRDNYGYGRYRAYRSHRLAWTLHNGPIPAGMSICHRCDNPPCCNPDHLFPGTQADNMADRRAKDRYRTQPRKLSAEQVKVIRERYAAGGITQEALGQEYGVTQAVISHAVRGDTHAHVDSSNLSRLVKGECNRKLAPWQVHEVRESRSRACDLAERFGVSTAAIYRIRAGVSYRNV